MDLQELRRKAVEATMRLMANESVRGAVDAALDAGQTVASELRTLRDEVKRQVEASRPVEDDTAGLKERLDRLRDAADESPDT